MGAGPVRHRLLRRQLQRHFAAGVPPELAAFLEDVDRAYLQADDDRALVERSLDLASSELLQRNEELRLSLVASGVGTFFYWPELDEMVCEGYPHPLTGRAGRMTGTPEQMLARLVPADRELAIASLRRAVGDGGELSLRLRVADRWLVLRGRSAADSEVVNGVCADITDEMAAIESETARRRSVEAQSAILFQLTHDVAEAGTDLERALRLISEASGKALGVERTAVWLYQPERGEVTCLNVFERSTGSHAPCATLPMETLAVALGAMADARVMAADDAQHDPRLIEWRAAYLVPLGITSTIDAPVRLGGRMVAFLHHAHVGAPRRWTPEEQAFAASVADLVALALEGQRRRGVESELDKQREFLRQVIDTNPNCIFTKDRAGRFTLVNQATAEVYGTTPDKLVGKTDSDFNSNAEQVAWFHKVDLEVLDSGRERFIPEEVITDSRGVARILQTVKRPIPAERGAPEQVLVVATDITERKRAEEERRKLEQTLRQAQRLESIGLLAGGMAHDFNNLLTPILAYAENISQSLPAGDPLADDLRDIVSAAKQARDLIAQLMALGRKQMLQVKPVDLNEEILAARKMLARLLPESITITLALAGAPVPALADPTQVQQVLINLAANARDAMLGGGELTISTAVAGEVVKLTLADTGAGIAADVLPHIFDPFFSTKELGRGTGLGLATVYGIVNQHGGSIEVESQPGRGATFAITLPRATLCRPAPAPVVPVVGRGGSETILVVEDELLVRKLVTRVLKVAGFTVLDAGSSEEALRLATGHAGAIDLLLTDVVMPRMDGVELYREMSRRRPSTRVLFMSGHVHDILGQHGILDEKTAILRKPFVPGDLTRAVRQMLDG